jgi:hypothetical protein
MKTLVSVIALAVVAIALTGSAYAAAPKSKAACEKAHLTWNAKDKKCS